MILFYRDKIWLVLFFLTMWCFLKSILLLGCKSERYYFFLKKSMSHLQLLNGHCLTSVVVHDANFLQHILSENSFSFKITTSCFVHFSQKVFLHKLS